VAATVVVVEVDVVVDVVDVVEVVLVDVVVGVVVEVVVVLVGDDAATAISAPDLSSPHAERTSRAANTAPDHSRRMAQSAIENQRCNVTADACWPDRMQAGMPIP
jgi:hypothetical protein